MATEGQRAPGSARDQNSCASREAPRIPPGRDSLAAAYVAEQTKAEPLAGLGALSAFGMNGMKPLYGLVGDHGNQHLANAHALLTVVSSAWRDAEEARKAAGVGQSTADNLFTLNGEIHAAALEGVATLVALAAFAGRAK